MSEESKQIDKQEQKPNDKEYNFRQLEAKYQRQLAEEQAKRQEAERLAQEAISQHRENGSDEEEEEDEPYVNHKRLNKKLNKFGQSTQSEIQKAMELAKQTAKEELKQEMWLESHPDYEDVLQLADKFAEKNPGLANAILKMPNNFERQKLVYENIKTLGLDKPEVKQSSIQQKIDQNRKGLYYHPTSYNAGPYNAGVGDFSPAGQKNAYEKMLELKNKLRV